MAMFAEGRHTLNPVWLLYQIKSARATHDRTGTGSMMPLAPPARTVGEENSKAGAPRFLLWEVAIILPCLYIGASMVFVHTRYPRQFLSDSYPWCLAAYMLWGIYMALVSVVTVYMDLFLPDAPVAAREALNGVGWLWIAAPFFLFDSHLTLFGQPWTVITLICLEGMLIASVLDFWAWLVRKYRK